MSIMPAVLQNYQPRIIEKYLHVAQGGYPAVIRYHSRGASGIRAIFIHVQEGNNRGSWIHFHSVKASSTVMIAQNGDIWVLVPEGKAPWTNGDVNQPDQIAIAAMNRWGWDPNTWSLTIECEGFSGNLPYTDAQFKSVLWQVWTWLVKYPTIEVVHIMRHGQVNSVTRSRCPEPAPYRFMRQIFAALDGASAGIPETPNPPTTIYRNPWPVFYPDGDKWDGAQDTLYNGIQFYADKRIVRVSGDSLNRRQSAGTLGNLSGTPLRLGETFNALGWVEGEEVSGERRWWVDKDYHRIWAGGTAEKPVKQAPKPTTPDDGVSKPDKPNDRDVIPVVLNGNVYTPVEQHGDEPGQAMKFLTNGNVRLWAATHAGSPVLKVYRAGETAKVGYWVTGERITQSIPNAKGKLESVTSDKWFVLGTGKEAIAKGGRIWSGVVVEA